MARRKESGPVETSPDSDDPQLIRQLWLGGLSVDTLAEKFERARESIWAVLEGERTVENDKRSGGFDCSFCNQSQTKVGFLIAGPRGSVCDDCLGAVLEILKESRPEWVRTQIGRSTPP